MNERTAALLEHVQDLEELGVRRSLFFPLIGQSLRHNSHLSVPLRRAKAFADLLEAADQIVHPHELLAGSILGLWPVEENLPDYARRVEEARQVLQRYRQEKQSGAQADKSWRWALMARDHYDANIPYDQLQKLIAQMQQELADDSLLPANEIARTLERHFVFRYDQDRQAMEELPWVVANHLDMNYPRVVRMGLGAIRSHIEGKLQAAQDPKQRTFYESTLLAISAVIDFTARYADTLEQAARDSRTPHRRRSELEEMARICRRISTEAPRTFREAMQLLWMAHIAANLGGGSALSFARFDQYMIDFYRADTQAGRIDEESAKELIACLWIKVNEPKMRTVQSLCLAGQTPQGTDGANELTRLCLEVCRDLRLPYPNTSVRLHKDSPDWLYQQVGRTVQEGIGQPMVLNDERWVPNLHRLGYRLEDARQYYNMGCVEIMLMGMMANWGWTGGGGIDLPGVVELVFTEGRENLAGLVGASTGPVEQLKTFDEFFQACKDQLRHRVKQIRQASLDRVEQVRGRYFDPLASALIDDCLEKGLDLFDGGARYEPIRAVGGFGLGTAADSIAAVKKFVYDEGQLSISELRDALANDYAGCEELRKLLETHGPAYGNDQPEVDAIAAELFDTYADAVNGLNDGSTPGGPFVTSVFSYNHHVYAGEVVGATPNGRKARAAFSDAIGPSQGRDENGPTCLINSVMRLDHSKITGAYALNLKLTPELVRGETGSDLISSLIRSCFAAGGVQMQINVVDSRTLREAQEQPEKHRNLIVRVAGYSEFFRNLDRNLQDEIIRRSEHSVG